MEFKVGHKIINNYNQIFEIISIEPRKILEMVSKENPIIIKFKTVDYFANEIYHKLDEVTEFLEQKRIKFCK